MNEYIETGSIGFELDKCRFKKERGRNWFTYRIVDEWNKLILYRSQVVNATTIENLKRRSDRFMDKR